MLVIYCYYETSCLWNEEYAVSRGIRSRPQTVDHIRRRGSPIFISNGILVAEILVIKKTWKL